MHSAQINRNEYFAERTYGTIVDYRVTRDCIGRQLVNGVADFCFCDGYDGHAEFGSEFMTFLVPKIVENFCIFEWTKKHPVNPRSNINLTFRTKDNQNTPIKSIEFEDLMEPGQKHNLFSGIQSSVLAVDLHGPGRQSCFYFLVQCIHFVRSARETSLSWIAFCCKSQANRNKIRSV